MHATYALSWPREGRRGAGEGSGAGRVQSLEQQGEGLDSTVGEWNLGRQKTLLWS
jgi:hypothetical protein